MDETTDFGYNITGRNPEPANMYWVNLLLKGYKDGSDALQSNFGVHGNGIVGALQLDTPAG